jgi:branched-subunit amino acid aminotransferase/4-amino-4-deoxychorismate lyase
MQTATFIAAIFFVFGLIQIIILLRQTRIINSMTLKVLLRICEEKGIKVDIEKIHDEVVKNV